MVHRCRCSHPDIRRTAAWLLALLLLTAACLTPQTAAAQGRRQAAGARSAEERLATATAAYLPLFRTPTSALAVDPAPLVERITVEAIQSHLQTFQDIADANGGQRSSGSSGFTASIDYVAETLSAAGYTVVRQPFVVNPNVWELVTPPTMVEVTTEPHPFELDSDFSVLTFSASGTLTATVAGVDLQWPPPETVAGATSGCERGDFTELPAGAIALVQQGQCGLSRQAEHALAAGASALLVASNGWLGNTGPVHGSIYGSASMSLPVLGISLTLAEHLVAAIEAGSDLRIALDVQTRVYALTAMNLLAETPGGDPNRLVMAGAHLDSVAGAPGINDNGSGAAALLEIARQFAALDQPPVNRVRFAWWGAEEQGMIGSSYYVGDLLQKDPDALRRIGLYLNFDMLASPNYLRAVYADSAESSVSCAATALFSRHFAAAGLASETFVPPARSDHAPFAAAGIPYSGLFTGAEGIATPAQAERYPHMEAGTPYDPCYHRPCDDLTNVNAAALAEMSEAAAHAIYAFAMSYLWTPPSE